MVQRGWSDLVVRAEGGVIDWQDLRRGDPAFGLTGLHDLRGGCCRRLVDARKGKKDATFRSRLRLYHRDVALHNFVSASETGRQPPRRAYWSKLEELYLMATTVGAARTIRLWGARPAR